MSGRPRDDTNQWQSPVERRRSVEVSRGSYISPRSPKKEGDASRRDAQKEDGDVATEQLPEPQRASHLNTSSSNRIAILGVSGPDAPLPTSPRRPSAGKAEPTGAAAGAGSHRRSTRLGTNAADDLESTPVAPLTEVNLGKFEAWQRAQNRRSRGEAPSPTANRDGGGTASSLSDGKGQPAREAGDRDSEDDEVYNARVEHEVISFIDETRGLTLYLDPCPPLPTTGLTPVSSARPAVSPRTAATNSPRDPRPGDKGLPGEEAVRSAARVLQRRGAERRMERAEVERKIRYITRDQLRQLYLDNHEELIDCIHELVTAEAKATDLDDELADMEKRVTLAEEEAEIARIQLSAAEECNESLLSEKAEIMRKLLESKGELAVLSARNIKLQQRLDGEDRSKSANDTASSMSGNTSVGNHPLLAAAQAKVEKELDVAKAQVAQLTAELAQARIDLVKEQEKRRVAEATVAEGVASDLDGRVEASSDTGRDHAGQNAKRGGGPYLWSAGSTEPPSPRMLDHTLREKEELREKCSAQEAEVAALRKELEHIRQQQQQQQQQQQRHPTSTTSHKVSEEEGGKGGASLALSTSHRSNSVEPHLGHSGSVDASQRSHSAPHYTPGGAADELGPSELQRELSRLKADLQRCERELAAEREHTRKQSEVETKLLMDVAHMARQLHSRERIERGVRSQRKADADLTKEQLIEELAELRSTVISQEATIAAFKRQQNGEAAMSGRSTLTLATNTTDNASRSSSAADHLCKDYISLTLPGASYTLSARMQGRLPPPPQQSASARAASAAASGSSPNRLPARSRYTNNVAGKDSSFLPATSSTSAASTSTPQVEGPSLDRASSPEIQRRRESLFAQLDAAKRSRDHTLLSDPIDPPSGDFTTTTTTATGRQVAEEGPRYSPPPPPPPRPHVTRSSLNSPRNGSSGAGVVASVVPIAPPARLHGHSLVMYAPATNTADAASNPAMPGSPLSERGGGAILNSPRGGGGGSGGSGNARKHVGSQSPRHYHATTSPPTAAAGGTSPIPEGAAKNDQAKPFSTFSLPGMPPTSITTATGGVSDTLRRSTSAALSISKQLEDDGVNGNNHSLSLSNATGTAAATNTADGPANDSTRHSAGHNRAVAVTRASTGSQGTHSGGTKTTGAGKQVKAKDPVSSSTGDGTPKAKKTKASAAGGHPDTAGASTTTASPAPTLLSGAGPASSRHSRRSSLLHSSTKGSGGTD